MAHASLVGGGKFVWITGCVLVPLTERQSYVFWQGEVAEAKRGFRVSGSRV